MEHLLQTLVVALLVTASAVFATWRLLPARTRLKLLDAVKPSPSHTVGRWLIRRRQAAQEEISHGCGSCSQSGSLKKHSAPRR